MALTGPAGLNRFLDGISPRENLIGEESFKKCTYNKPAPQRPERPHEIGRPGGEKAYERLRRSTERVNRTLGRVQSFTKLLDKRKGMEVEDELRAAAMSLL